MAPTLLSLTLCLAGLGAAPPDDPDDIGDEDGGEDDADIEDDVGDEDDADADADADTDTEADEDDDADPDDEEVDDPDDSPDADEEVDDVEDEDAEDDEADEDAGEPPERIKVRFRPIVDRDAGPSVREKRDPATTRGARRSPSAGGGLVFIDDGSSAPVDERPRALQPLVLGRDSLIIGGYIQPGFVGVRNTDFNPDDAERFELANARLTGRGRVTVRGELWVGFNLNLDVNRARFRLRDLYGSIGWRDDLVRVDVGQLKQPFSLALLQSEARLQLPRSSPLRRLAFGRDQGVQLSSQGTVGKRVWLHGAFMMANGGGEIASAETLNPDGRFQYTGRFEIGPLGEVPLSSPDLEDSDPKFVLAAHAGHTERLDGRLGVDDVGASETRVGGDGRFHFRGLSVRAEYLHGLRGDSATSLGFARWAFSAQAGYVLPIPLDIPRFEVVFRYTQLDLNDRRVGTENVAYVLAESAARYFEPGLSVYLVGHAAKLHLSYLRTELLEGPGTATPLIGDTVSAFLQFAWL